MKMVMVFKTNVNDQQDAAYIMEVLQKAFTHCKINFDLDDCDRILRVEGLDEVINENNIHLLVAGCGYYCEPLPG